MNTRKTIWIGVAVWAVPLLLGASLMASPFDQFKSRVQNNLIKPFAKDLGGVLGGGDFHSGRALGFPGFDVQATAAVQFKPDKDNVILDAAGVKAFGVPRVQVEVGLPYNIDVIARGLSAYGGSILGGGLRYGIWKTKVLGMLPDIAVSAFGDRFDHDLFKVSHFSFNLVVSFNLPVIKPYLGVGLDSTKVTIKDAANPALIGLSAKSTGSRITAGVDLTFIPFTHVYGAYSLFNGNSGAEFGLGVRF